MRYSVSTKEIDMAQLRITDGTGFQVKFDNGVSVSVQIGAGYYGDNYSLPFSERAKSLPPSSRAEIAAYDQRGEWINFDGDPVKGYVPVEDVFTFLRFIQELPSDLHAHEIELALKAFYWRDDIAA
jgi:hypothetical protein